MISGEEVKKAVEAAGITRVDHHDCSMCGFMTHYFVIDSELYFNHGCDCTGRYRVSERSWNHAAEWVNMQSKPEIAAKVASYFGLTLDQPTV